MTKWGFRVSKLGKSVLSTDPRDRLLDSDDNMLKYHSDNTGSVIINPGDTEKSVDFTHTLGYVPAFIAYTVDPSTGKQQFIPAIPRLIDYNNAAFAYADSTKVRAGRWFQNGFSSYLADYTQVYSEFFASTALISVGDITGLSGHPQNGAMRFINVTVPQGATITSAVLNYAVQGKGGGTGDLKIQTYGIAEDNTNSFGNPMGRTRTTAVTTQNVSLPPTGNYFGINVTSQVQEILNRGGWVSGNAMGFLIFDNGSPTNVRADDNNGSGIESSLQITYGGSTTLYFRVIIFKNKIA